MVLIALAQDIGHRLRVYHLKAKGVQVYMDERSDAEIGEALHITKSGAREARYKLFAKLKALLSDFADYFKK